MSRGPGWVQRFALDYLAAHPPKWVMRADYNGRPPYRDWDCGFVTVDELAAYCRHHRGCGDHDPLRCEIDFAVSRAEVESMRRAVKQLAKAGRVELTHRSLYTDAGNRTNLCCRLPLSVEQAEHEREGQRLQEERRRAFHAEVARMLGSAQ